MTTKFRAMFIVMVLTAVFSLVILSAQSQAGDDDEDIKAAKAVQVTLKKMGESFKKGEKAEAKKTAVEAVKKIEETKHIMMAFRQRNKGGMGVGEKAGTNPAKDCIETTLRDLARDVPAGVAKQAEALETTGYWIAALGEMSIAKGWPKDQGKKTKKAWTAYSEEMREAGIEFAKAAAAKGGQEIKKAAGKVNSACNNCHSIFKD